METVPLSAPASAILNLASSLDYYGARTWNLRVVTTAMSAFFYLVRITLGKKGGIDWYPLSHAAITGLGSLMCIYLDVFWAEQLTGIPEPVRNAQCGEPLTSIHILIPAITMGYSLLDILDGLAIAPEFVAHGVATFSVMAFFCETGIAHLMTPMLLMEISSIFLSLVRCKTLPPPLMLAVQLLFVITFFVFRVVLVPYLWFERVLAVRFEVAKHPEYGACIPNYFFPVIPIFGLFFHTLNFYWFVKIMQKMYRKITRIEKIDENNDLGEKGL